MEKNRQEVIDAFGNRLRVRVNGIYAEDDKVLLINHRALRPDGDFWAPPGGGMDYGSSAESNLRREFEEETGLQIKVENFLFVHEYLDVPLHAIELFFSVKKVGGRLALGSDPEMSDDKQIITELKMMHFEEIKSLDRAARHQAFDGCDSVADLMNRRGYWRF